MLGNSTQKLPTVHPQSTFSQRHLPDRNLVLLVHIVQVDNKVLCFSVFPQSVSFHFKFTSIISLMSKVDLTDALRMTISQVCERVSIRNCKQCNFLNCTDMKYCMLKLLQCQCSNIPLLCYLLLWVFHGACSML